MKLSPLTVRYLYRTRENNHLQDPQSHASFLPSLAPAFPISLPAISLHGVAIHPIISFSFFSVLSTLWPDVGLIIQDGGDRHDEG